MYFETPSGSVYEPENPMLRSFYEALKKHAPTLAGSPVFEDFKEVYEALEFDMRGEKSNEPTITAV
ncbi:hypothetical protein [Siminovitchia sp. FSL W7-1587]|uniref:hypothetical protein n=1 Tax=Siminovitchia sp. FSL W7-1587 TaxID=2954699 RepID=UPI0030CF036B